VIIDFASFLVESVPRACSEGKWTLIAPDGRAWQCNPFILSAALLAEIGGSAVKLDAECQKVLDDNLESLYEC